METLRLEGFASPGGTERYAFRFREQFPIEAFRRLGKTGLVTSSVSCGTYRMSSQTPENVDAFQEALLRGCNLVETSNHYCNGKSEELVGTVLYDLAQRGKLKREEIIIVSKVGCIQGDILREVQSREEKGVPFPEMEKITCDLWYCIEPKFIQWQLTESLRRLKLESIDVYLLHNPEWILNSLSSQITKETLCKKIRSAFLQMEKEVENGRIAFYGVSSNAFISNEKKGNFISLNDLWEIASSVAFELTANSDKHHFRVIEFPLNLIEQGTLVDKRQTPLEFATAQSMGVLVNRPLNAVLNQRLIRLSQPVRCITSTELEMHLNKLAELEEEFLIHFDPHLQPNSKQRSRRAVLRFSEEIRKIDLSRLALEHWKQIESNIIRPRTRYVVSRIDRYLVGELFNGWRNWRDRYLPLLELTLTAIETYCGGKESLLCQSINECLDEIGPLTLRGKPLTQKAISLIAQTSGISTVLVGMRKPAYVRDAIQTMSYSPFKVDPDAWKSLENLVLAALPSF